MIRRPVGALIRIDGVEIGDELGHGAYSVVYRARRGETHCALKVPHSRGRWTRWVYREAVALTRVRHPGLPRVLEVGETDGLPYILMELVEGETLADRLLHGPVGPDVALDLACQLADTLRAVREVGLVHRDVQRARTSTRSVASSSSSSRAVHPSTPTPRAWWSTSLARARRPPSRGS